MKVSRKRPDKGREWKMTKLARIRNWERRFIYRDGADGDVENIKS